MRPDVSCTNTQHVPKAKRPPCPFHYMQGSDYKCQLIDIVIQAAQQGKRPKDLISEGTLTRETFFTFFVYCIKLKVVNPEAVCNECGECCKLWADIRFCEHPDKPCKPLDGTIQKPANPCTKLVKKGQIYKCAEYGDIPNCPDRLPDGTDMDLFMALLDGSLLICIDVPTQQIKMKTCPSCVYEFVRSET